MNLGNESRRTRVANAARIGLFGVLGAGNIGNDASMESMLSYLTAAHPHVMIDAMCGGPEHLQTKYGIDAIPQQWQQKYENVPRLSKPIVKILGKFFDVFRTMQWVRRHDLVIVPGAGVLEASLPLGPWTIPYSMFLLCLAGRIFDTKVALVSVGADTIKPRLTRWFSTTAARLAWFRSYRDQMSLEAMQRRGLDTSEDRVYPDLVFGLTPYVDHRIDLKMVGLGVMAYYGSNDDRDNAENIHKAYVQNMKLFVRYLVDSDHKVKLFVGDVKWDYEVVDAIFSDLAANRPTLAPGTVSAEPITTFEDLAQAMAPVGTVVAIRYHNVMCALKLCKPTISISYSRKHDVLMQEMGLPGFHQSANSLHVERLIAQFEDLESRAHELSDVLEKNNREQAALVEQQLQYLLSSSLPTRDRCQEDVSPVADAGGTKEPVRIGQ